MFSASRDRLTSNAAKAFLNERLANYGRLDELELDSTRRRIRLVCLLHGETTPVEITIERYEIEQELGETRLVVRESAASRPWLQALLRDHLHGRKIPLPGWVAALL